MALAACGAPGKAPAFALPDLDGRFHRMEDAKRDMVLLAFVSSQEPACFDAAPALRDVHHRFDRLGLASYAIHPARSGNPFAFRDRAQLGFPLLLDDSGVFAAYNIRELPTVLLVDRNRNVFESWSGFGPDDYDDLAAWVRGQIVTPP